MMLFALYLTSFQAHAQRYLPGMKALQVTAGMTGGGHWNAHTDFCHPPVLYSLHEWVLPSILREGGFAALSHERSTNL